VAAMPTDPWAGQPLPSTEGDPFYSRPLAPAHEGPHTMDCIYDRGCHPCPDCGAMVPHIRLACQPFGPPSRCERCSLACSDCASEVRTSNGRRYRVIHSATCPWLAEHLATGRPGRIPCGTTVTHRGPYKRRPAA
jgi:hypothetical protein